MSAQRLNDYLPRDRNTPHDRPLLQSLRRQQDPAPPPTRPHPSLTDTITGPLRLLWWDSCLFLAWAFVGILASHGQLPLHTRFYSRPNQSISKRNNVFGHFDCNCHSCNELLINHHSLRRTSSFQADVGSYSFFTKAIGRALTSRLCWPSLRGLHTGIELSKGSSVLASRRLSWTIATILCVVMLNTLTAA
jgi:hypothetical protein